MDGKYDNSHKVYEKEEFIILKVHSGKKIGYIAYNTNKEWKDGHTHLDSFDMAKTIISNVMKQKKEELQKTSTETKKDLLKENIIINLKGRN